VRELAYLRIIGPPNWSELGEVNGVTGKKVVRRLVLGSKRPRTLDCRLVGEAPVNCAIDFLTADSLQSARIKLVATRIRIQLQLTQAGVGLLFVGGSKGERGRADSSVTRKCCVERTDSEMALRNFWSILPEKLERTNESFGRLRIRTGGGHPVGGRRYASFPGVTSRRK